MKENLKLVAATLTTTLVLLALWLWITGPGGVPETILPTPNTLFRTFWFAMSSGSLNQHIAFTLTAAALGLLIAAVASIVIGAICVMIPAVEAAVYPVVVATQSIPKIAIAPVVIAAMGFGIESKIFTVVVLCFFPLFVATITGMRSLDASYFDLYRSVSASRLHMLIHARIPAAAPYFFSALQIAITLSLIGSIVAEFVASSKGLGFIIKMRSEEMDVAMMFTAIFILSIIGVIGTSLVSMARRRIIFWQPT